MMQVSELTDMIFTVLIISIGLSILLGNLTMKVFISGVRRTSISKWVVFTFYILSWIVGITISLLVMITLINSSLKYRSLIVVSIVAFGASIYYTYATLRDTNRYLNSKIHYNMHFKCIFIDIMMTFLMDLIMIGAAFLPVYFELTKHGFHF